MMNMAKKKKFPDAKTTTWIFDMYTKCRYDLVHGGQKWVPVDGETIHNLQHKYEAELLDNEMLKPMVTALKETLDDKEKELEQAKKDLENEKNFHKADEEDAKFLKGRLEATAKILNEIPSTFTMIPSTLPDYTKKWCKTTFDSVVNDYANWLERLRVALKGENSEETKEIVKKWLKEHPKRILSTRGEAKGKGKKVTIKCFTTNNGGPIRTGRKIDD